MWETHLLFNGPVQHASTESAIQAAGRVFSQAHLMGLTRSQVIALLGDPRTASNSGYNFPFYPAPAGALVYRFDTGAGGWQFNVTFGRGGLVSEIQRLPII